MNESPDTTGCEGMAVRPTIRMHNYGRLVAAFPTATYADGIGGYDHHGTYDSFSVEMWFQSPTGDQSDSVILHLPCRNGAQASAIAAMHREIWGIPNYGADPAVVGPIASDIDGIPMARRDVTGGPVPIV